LPTHYEPLESPLANPLYTKQTNPAANWFSREDNRFIVGADPRFPYVLTTYRLTEHHTAGGMSRFLSHLAELQPELFAEISPELAGDLGVENGEWITVSTPRGIVEARALVTRRMRPIHLGDRVVHQVAMPFHWGSAGPVKGDVVNDLIPLSGEPNVTIHESKALTCTLRKGRRPPDDRREEKADPRGPSIRLGEPVQRCPGQPDHREVGGARRAGFPTYQATGC
jgi:formate dehydrogenase major subunit